MKFIFPKNYSFKYKLLGFIDYSTAILDAVVGLVLYGILSIFISNMLDRVYVFIILFLPILLFSVFGLGQESLLSVICYMFNFFKNQNVYLYSKNHNQEEVDKR